MCKWTRRTSRLADDLPLNVANAALGWVGELVKGVRRKVEIAVGARLAPVRQSDIDGDPIVSNLSHLVAQRVVVWVDAIVTRVGIKEQVRDSGNVLTIIIGNTASAQTSSIEGSLTGVDRAIPSAVVVASRRGRGGRRRGWGIRRGWGWGRRGSRSRGGRRVVVGLVRGRSCRLRVLGRRAGRCRIVDSTLDRWGGLSGRRKTAAAAAGLAAAVTTLAETPPGRGRDITTSHFCERGSVWLRDPSSDLPVVVTLTSEMRGHGRHRDGGGEEDCELS